MDASETLAFEFLHSRGVTEIVYEPHGNVPPDFVCAGKTAVEVRRLNQHDGYGRGLEQVSLPLAMRFNALLASLGPAQGASWFWPFAIGDLSRLGQHFVRRSCRLWRGFETIPAMASCAFKFPIDLRSVSSSHRTCTPPPLFLVATLTTTKEAGSRLKRLVMVSGTCNPTQKRRIGTR
jgi:hypothetical protein